MGEEKKSEIRERFEDYYQISFDATQALNLTAIHFDEKEVRKLFNDHKNEIFVDQFNPKKLKTCGLFLWGKIDFLLSPLEKLQMLKYVYQDDRNKNLFCRQLDVHCRRKSISRDTFLYQLASQDKDTAAFTINQFPELLPKEKIDALNTNFDIDAVDDNTQSQRDINNRPSARM